jgi:hypothetical protein
MAQRTYASLTSQANGDFQTPWDVAGSGDSLSDNNVDTRYEAAFVATVRARGQGATDGAIPAGAVVTQVKSQYYVRDPDASPNFSIITPYIYFSASGNRVFASTSLSNDLPYNTWVYIERIWATDPDGNAWTVANFFLAWYGLQAEMAPSDQIQWSELRRSITFTLPSPSATTDPATGVTSSQATLNGTVDPGGATADYPVHYKFQWGLTTSYGNETAIGGPLTGSGGQAVSATITGLTPGTNYHFRVVAYNDDVTINGADRTTTSSGTPSDNGQNGDEG